MPIPPHAPEHIEQPLRLSLRDGAPVLLRPLRAEDQHYLAEGLERLSAGTRLSRFFTPIAHLSEQQLAYLSGVDQEHHVAWGAMAATGEGLGVGRYARLASEPEVAEIAVTVVDEAQRRGLGSLLLGILYLSAQAHGVRSFRAIVLPENRELVRWLCDLGGRAHPEEDLLRIDLPVHADLSRLPETASAEMFRHLLARLRAALEAAA